MFVCTIRCAEVLNVNYSIVPEDYADLTFTLVQLKPCDITSDFLVLKQYSNALLYHSFPSIFLVLEFAAL